MKRWWKMRKVSCAGLLALVCLGLVTTACTRSASFAASPTPSPTVAPTSTPAFTPRPSPKAPPTRDGSVEHTVETPGADGPAALVDRFAEAWMHGTAQDVANLFAAEIEYQMGPNYITDKGTLWWFTEYWKAGGGNLLVTHCDPELGNTIRCDLEFTSDCTPALGWGPLYFDAKFTVRRGKIEKMIATMPEEVFRELSKVLEGMFAWAGANMATPWAEAMNSGDPRAAGRIEVQACIEYAKSVRATPTP